MRGVISPHTDCVYMNIHCAQFLLLVCDRWRSKAASHIPATQATGVITGFR